MAYSFGGSRLNRLTSASVLPASGPRPFSIGVRIKQASTNDRSFGVSQWIFENTNGQGNPNLGLAITVSSGANRLSLYTNGAYTHSATWTAITDWHSLLLTFATGSPGAVVSYRNGATLTSTTATFGGDNYQAVSTIGGLANTGGGFDPANDSHYDSNAGFNIDGSLGEFCIWNVVLDAAEAHAWTNGASGLLIRPAALRSYMPFINGVAQDLYRGGVWTEQGSNTKQADHPRVLLRGGPILIGRPAASSDVTGTAAGVIASLTGASTAAHGVAGTAAGNISALAGAAAAAHGVAGTAAGIIAQIVGDATGAHGVAGTSDGIIAALTGAAAGANGVAGTAAGDIAAVIGAASAVHGVAGSVAGLIAPLTGEAEGEHTPLGVSGAGAGLIAPLTGESAGAHGVAGTSDAILAMLSGAASGAHGVSGSAAGIIVPVAGAAVAAHGVVGQAAGAIRMLTGSAVGQFGDETPPAPLLRRPLVATPAILLGRS